MKYLERLLERKLPAQKVGTITTKGRTGTTASDTDDPRLVDKEGKPKRSAKEIVKNNTAGPKGKLPDHTEYQRIGALMAEALGLLESAPGRTSFDHDAQQSAAEGKHGKEVQKSKRATSDTGSGISIRLKSGMKPSYRGQKTTYRGDQTAGGGGSKADNTAGPKGKLPDHTEYKRIGALMAEALGYRVDEIAPALAAIPAVAAKGAMIAGKGAMAAGRVGAKVVGKTVKSGAKATGRAVRKTATDVGASVADRMQNKNQEVEEASDPTEKDLAAANKDVHTKKTVKGETPKETAAVNKSIDKAMGKKKVGAKGGIEGLKASIRAAGQRGQEKLKKERQEAGVDDWTVYKQIGMALAEAHQAYTDEKAKKDLAAGKPDAGFAGPIARGAAKSNDPVVKRGQKAAGKRIEKKVPGADASKISKENLTQAALLARRKKMRKSGVGLPSGPLPKGASAAMQRRELETPEDRRR